MENPSMSKYCILNRTFVYMSHMEECEGMHARYTRCAPLGGEKEG